RGVPRKAPGPSRCTCRRRGKAAMGGRPPARNAKPYDASSLLPVRIAANGREAAELLARAAPGEAMLVAGGTDLLPNMKRRQQVPQTLIGLRRVAGLREIANGDGLHIGAGVTLTDLVRDHRVRRKYGALWQAAAPGANAQLRHMGALGRNLCPHTRGHYSSQNYWVP